MSIQLKRDIHSLYILIVRTMYRLLSDHAALSTVVRFDFLSKEGLLSFLGSPSLLFFNLKMIILMFIDYTGEDTSYIDNLMLKVVGL